MLPTRPRILPGGVRALSLAWYPASRILVALCGTRALRDLFQAVPLVSERSPTPAPFLSARPLSTPEREAALHLPPARFEPRESIAFAVLPTRRRGLPGIAGHDAQCRASSLLTGAGSPVVGH